MTDTKVMKIYLTGDVYAEGEIVAGKNLILPVTVTRAKVAELAAQCQEVIYAKSADNALQSFSANVSEKCTGNSATATKLQNERKITLQGDVDAEMIFDGSSDLKINVKVKKSESADTDGDGNNFIETYETKENVAALKNELPPFKFSIGEFENNPCLILTDKNGKTFRFIGEAVS